MADVLVNINSDIPTCSGDCNSSCICKTNNGTRRGHDYNEKTYNQSTPRSNLRTSKEQNGASDFQKLHREEKQNYDRKLENETTVQFDGRGKNLEQKRTEHLFTSTQSQSHRRAKINLRERKRMHDLNEALESLREVMPYANGPSVRRLSKIATLSLARNYIQMLTKSIEDLRRVLDEVFRANPAMASSCLASRSVHTTSGLAHGFHGLYLNGHANTSTPAGITSTVLHRQYLTNSQQTPTMAYPPNEFTCNIGHPCELHHLHCVLTKNGSRGIDSAESRFK